ncbi:MAG: hypothetical protein C0410_01900 [Anaerolinea sp.]|nr:hypothetical protein [Anaerolinea sp.]
MKRSQKLILLCMMMIILMACNCGVLDNIKNIIGLDSQSNQESPSDQEAENPFSSEDSTNQSSDQSNLPKDPFDIYIPTELNIVDGVLDVSQRVTLYDSAANMYQSYLVLENSSSDPIDMIFEFTYKITWYDQDKQIVDEWANTFNSKILPQERILFYLWPEESKVADRTIVSTVFEVSEIKTAKIIADSEWLTKLAGLPITHPIVSINPSDFTFGYEEFVMSLIPVARTNVEIQSNLTAQAKVQVIGLYQNANGELIGIGRSEPVSLDPGVSATSEVYGANITEQPAQADYFVEIVSPSDTFEVAYPDMFK